MGCSSQGGEGKQGPLQSVPLLVVLQGWRVWCSMQRVQLGLLGWGLQCGGACTLQAILPDTGRTSCVRRR